MEAFWFAAVSVMLAVYVVLDGFDFGAGILHRYVARTDDERRTVLAAIGPFWDGNEVWLIASGGVLFFAFPKAYAASFSGFYMPMTFVLWLLIFRGIGMEFRSHLDNGLWREFWDTMLMLASAAMAVVLGTALGNVVRGVPIGESGYFAMPLFNDLSAGENAGLFDWYTLGVGVFSLALLAGHGALFLTWKTEGTVHDRSRVAARRLWPAIVLLWLAGTAATGWLRSDLFNNLAARPWTLVLVAAILGSLAGVFIMQRKGRERDAFLASSVFIVSILAATMAGNYPDLLRSTIDPKYSLTAINTASSEYGLRVGMAWWCVGAPLAIAYFVFLFRTFAGKVKKPTAGPGY